MLLFLLASLAAAKTTLDITPGFDGRFRPGRWSPVYVTVQSDAPHTADLSLHVPNASGSALTIHQTIGIGAEKQTYVLYAPLSMMDDPLRASLADHDTGKPLADWPADPATANSRFGLGGEQVGFLAVSSGRLPMMAGFTRSNVSGPTIVTHLPQSRLPATAAGYDSLDLLALNHPDLEAISPEQQQAIVAWLRSGGTLVIWPGPDSLPSGPLAGALPATPGDNTTIALSPQTLRAYTLPDRFKTIGARTLLPREGSARVQILGSAVEAVAGRLGLGRIIVLPVDASSLQFGSAQQSNDFWNTLLDPFYTLQQTSSTSLYNPSDMAASQAALERIGHIEGVGTFGFSYVVILIGAMMLLVGPVDYFVLRKLGRQPWTWTTVTGWIGLFTAAGLMAGHLFQSGDLHFRTLQIVEQAGDRTVGGDEVALIYAPRSADYAVNAERDSWWQPVPSGYRYGGGGYSTAIELAQDYRGNTPSRVWIDVWNFNFLQGRTYADGAPWVEANLRRDGDRIRGIVKNLLDRPLKNVQVALRGMDTAGVGDVGPGQSLTVDLSMTKTDASPAQQNYYPPYNQIARAPGASEAEQLFEIDAARAAAANRPPLPGGPQGVQLIAETEDALPDLTTPDPKAVARHSAVYRATFDLKP